MVIFWQSAMVKERVETASVLALDPSSHMVSLMLDTGERCSMIIFFNNCGHYWKLSKGMTWLMRRHTSLDVGQSTMQRTGTLPLVALSGKFASKIAKEHICTLWIKFLCICIWPGCTIWSRQALRWSLSKTARSCTTCTPTRRRSRWPCGSDLCLARIRHPSLWSNNRFLMSLRTCAQVCFPKLELYG